MAEIGAQASLFILYAKAIWFYWLLIMGTLAVIWGEHADRFIPKTKEGLNKLVSKERRRQIEIFAMMAALLFAGFEAWENQHDAARRAEAQRVSAVQWLGIWKARADNRWQAINNPGGYKDRIQRLETAPPSVPKEPPHRGPAPPSAEQKAHWDNVIGALRNEYVNWKAANGGVSLNLMSGTELPPDDWMNKRLGELHETFRVKARGLQWEIYQQPPKPHAPTPPSSSASCFNAHFNNLQISGAEKGIDLPSCAAPVFSGTTKITAPAVPSNSTGINVRDPH